MPNIQVTNQKRSRLEPNYLDDIKQPMDVAGIIKNIVSKTLFEPLLPQSPATITVDGQPITEDDIVDLMAKCCGENVDVDAEEVMRKIFEQTLLTFKPDTCIGMAEVFPVQSAAAENLDDPDSVTKYTPAIDVIPSARGFIAGTATYDMFFASLAYYARPETLGFYFINEIAFDNFITWLQGQHAMLAPGLSSDVNKMVSDFLQLKLPNLTESILIRNDDTEGNDPLSFPRFITYMLMNYASVAGPAEYGILPFHFGELVCPKSLVFVNVERHSRATARQVSEEWKLIRDSLDKNSRPKMVSNKTLTKLTAQKRILQKIAAQAATATQQLGAQRAAVFKFSKDRPTTTDITKRIMKLLNKMGIVNRSMNVYKQVKPTFAKPNRRDPDDFNKQGKIVSTKYKPNIHAYIDTSGSITEKDYEDAIKACIALAKKLNINMYFNSFSHVLSQTTRLHLENKSKDAIYKEFQKVPKVTGGTDYSQIWRFIERSPKRRNELSLIITDFQWTAPTQFIPHPRNLYYLPCSVLSFDMIKRYAEEFCKSTVHNDPDIRKHVLF